MLSHKDISMIFPRALIIALLVVAMCGSALAQQDLDEEKSVFSNIPPFPDSCNPSIKLTKQEVAYGPPSDPNIETTKEEYKARLKRVSNDINNSDRLYELAYIAFKNDDFDVAEKYFSKSLEVDDFKIPFYKTHIHIYFAWIDEKNNRLTEAKSHFQERGDKYYMHLIQAKIYTQDGKIDLAEREYLLAQSVKLYEMQNITPYIYLAEMFLELNNYVKAKDSINKYLECASILHEFPILDPGYSIPESEIEEAEKLLKKIEGRLQKNNL